MARAKRLFQLSRLPISFLQAIVLVMVCAIWLVAFSWFWTFMVLELPKDLGPYSQMSSLSMFMHRAFPMRETHDTRFEYSFEHILILAVVITVLMISWPQSRKDIQVENARIALKALKK